SSKHGFVKVDSLNTVTAHQVDCDRMQSLWNRFHSTRHRSPPLSSLMFIPVYARIACAHQKIDNRGSRRTLRPITRYMLVSCRSSRFPPQKSDGVYTATSCRATGLPGFERVPAPFCAAQQNQTHQGKTGV